jgi:crossover junction endodeoxyribonuclease RuvC
MEIVRILGIDPGFDRMGVCVLEKVGTKESLVYSACIVTSKKESFESRLALIGRELESVLKKHAPHELAIEKLFFAKNQTTAINVAEVRGVVLYISHLHGLSVHEYSPPQIKLAVTGYGRASKDDIASMVPKILGKALSGKLLDDELDAIAIALTHSAHRKLSPSKIALLSKGE